MAVWQRYLLYQIPGWLLASIILTALWRADALPVSYALLIFGAYVVKDIVLYPFLRRSYETDSRKGAELLVGQRGVAAEALAPEGYIRVRGELWRASVRPESDTIPEGSPVRIEEVSGSLLLVRPE
jgi:membrane protein implicated in regulation of membrane protease activity